MSPPKIKDPFALKEILFNALLEVPIDFVIDKLLAVEKLTLPKVVEVVRESKALFVLTTKEPAPVKLTILPALIEEALTSLESIAVIVAEKPG
jgi:hypothetical protein